MILKLMVDDDDQFRQVRLIPVSKIFLTEF